MQTNDLAVRRAVDSDAGAVAEVWLRAFTAALPGVRRAHTDDQVRSWFREVVVCDQETWVATVEASVVGMMVVDGEALDQLYLGPACAVRVAPRDARATMSHLPISPDRSIARSSDMARTCRQDCPG